MIPLILYCPKCHKRINIPKFINNLNVLTDINIECADKKCGGKIKIKNKNNGNVLLDSCGSKQ
jgi:hypothetical protein